MNDGIREGDYDEFTFFESLFFDVDMCSEISGGAIAVFALFARDQHKNKAAILN